MSYSNNTGLLIELMLKGGVLFFFFFFPTAIIQSLLRQTLLSQECFVTFAMC